MSRLVKGSGSEREIRVRCAGLNMKMQTALPVKYHLKRQSERIGPIELSIDCLENLDQTIDSLFEQLKITGDEKLLEDLCPYFGVVWPSARALAEYLAEALGKSAASNLSGAIRVLEMGCGLAIPSLLAARLGVPAGIQVTATDFHPEVIHFLSRNLALNGIEEGKVEYLRLDWRAVSELPRQFDWVIGSDILYERQQPECVAQAIDALLLPNGRAIVADPGRPYLQGFVDEMKKRGFTHATAIREVADPPGRKEIFLLAFQRGSR